MKLNARLMAVTLLVLMLLLSFMTVSVTPASSEQRGAKIDKLRFKVIRSPDDQLIAMQKGELDVLTDLRRPRDIEELDGDGFTITSAPSFHMGNIGFNIRPDQSYRGRPEVGPVLSDVNFRHACFHAYNQEVICASLYGYTVKPIQSLVPPAQGGWYNPAVPKHPYNSGDKYADTNEKDVDGNYINRYPFDHSSCGILRYGGYVYSSELGNWVTPFDLDGDGTAGTADVCKQEFDNFIQDPDDVIPHVYLFTPVGPCGIINEHGARFVADCNAIGIPLVHAPSEFWWYITKVFDYTDFDMYMGFWRVGRFPDHLYLMAHSSQRKEEIPCGRGGYNAPGINDPELDEKLETMVFSLNHAEKVEAAHEAQRRLFDETNPQALAYMQLYSRMFFNAFNPGLKGIINSPGFGSDNSWTYMNMHWEPSHPNERIEDGKSMVIWSLGEEPERLNPCYSKTTYEWDIMDRIYDPLIAINPYTHEDLPWLAESWEMLEDPDGVPGAMNVTFHLRTDIYWQDGEPYTAEDAKFNWLFLRDNEIPRYSGIWGHIVDVEIINTYTVKVILDMASQWLLYDLSETATLLPPPVWADWDGKPLNAILSRDPSEELGPQSDPAKPWYCPTNLYGTGLFIFDHYDSTLRYLDLLQNPNYFKTKDETPAQIVDMFHEVGDVNYDGVIWADDRGQMGLKFGKFSWEPEYDPDVDVNEDGVIDIGDLTLANHFFGDQREYP